MFSGKIFAQGNSQKTVRKQSEKLSENSQKTVRKTVRKQSLNVSYVLLTLMSYVRLRRADDKTRGNNGMN